MKVSSHLIFNNLYFYLFILVLCFSCRTPNEEPTPLFSLIDSNHSTVHFTNNIEENLYFNFINYSYIYNGAGVAVGDINNDGLEDIYFSSNQGANKLYINKGNFKFEDISNQANVTDENGWSTGVSMIDINNDGWLDIYVCKSASLENNELRKNKLFINQKNNTFQEKAADYGIDHFGFSTQAYFFDYDNDMDLDLFLLNHRPDFQNNTSINPVVQSQKQPYSSDQLFRNDGNSFTNVTIAAGIENKAWGLSASIGDFNNDNLPDIFVANDFLEADFLYVNQGDGTFKDEILNSFKHISTNSMGSDYADINNDLKPDLIVLDMLAEDHIRSKENMATMSTENFNSLVNAGYHHQYMSNMLQLNNGDGSFSEIAQLAGIAKTDWSWAPLIADFDNDGFNDLFVTNGIEHDLSNQDFRNQMKTNIQNRKKVSLDEAINMMPSQKLSNYIFRNNSDLSFSNKTKEWGLDAKVNSSGAVYSDLDNDGDLDIITNNQSEEAQMYQNNTQSNYVTFSLVGNEANINGIGAKVNLYAKDLRQTKILYSSRGYQSSVTNKLHFGLGEINTIDSIKIAWPNGSFQVIKDLAINNNIELNYKNARYIEATNTVKPSLFESINPTEIGIDYSQKENDFNDFDLQILLPQKQSEISNPLAVADVNNDGLDDFFVGNAKDANASLYIQKKDGSFLSSNEKLFEEEKVFEDSNAAFIDFDGDDDVDLYVTSGGYENEEGSKLLQDRLYENDGSGNFKRSNALPNINTNSKAITTSDYDNDGDEDIFIGGSVKPGQYPLADPSYLLKNENGKFINVTEETIQEIADLQLVKDAVFSDFDNDGDMDLIVVGEWMPITIFENKNSEFFKKDMEGLNNMIGWFQSIKEVDLENDGIKDYIIGNWGTNNKFHPSEEKPLHIYAGDLDGNASFDMALSKVSKTGTLIPVRGKECSSQQTPFINNKLKTFEEFANSTLPGIYGQDRLSKATHLEANVFETFVLKNNKEFKLEVQLLPNQAQFSPTLGIEVHDINNDGYVDIFGVGNLYDAEVETVRYDASKGYIFFGKEGGIFEFSADSSYFSNSEAKAIKKININNEAHFIILNKNNPLKILKLNSSTNY
jgi:hypothetical protein